MGARCSQITCNANEQWEKVDEKGDFNVWEDDLSSSLVIIHTEVHISYILIEDHLKIYNFKFVLIKKRLCLCVT